MLNVQRSGSGCRGTAADRTRQSAVARVRFSADAEQFGITGGDPSELVAKFDDGDTS